MFRIPTALIAAAGLIGGYAVAATTENRPLGGLVLAIGGAMCAWIWYRSLAKGPASALLATYVGAFVVSHMLALAIGPWPSVLTVAAITAAAAYFVADRSVPRAVTPA